MNWIIIDWAYNKMNFGEFKTFEDGWDYLMNKFPNDEDLQEYEVIKKEAIR